MAGIPEETSIAIEKSFLETGSPRGLTQYHSTGVGNFKDRGIAHYAHEGLLKRIVAGHFGASGREIQNLMIENKIEAYNFPQGVLATLPRDIAARRPGVIKNKLMEVKDMSYKAKGQYLDDFEVGDEYTTASRTVTETDVINFAGLSGDYNPLHVDEEFAQNTMFKSRIAHGALVYSIATGLSNQLGIFEGTTIAMIGSTQNYVGAVKFGDTVKLVLNTTNKKDTSKPGRGILTMDYSIINQRDEAVIKGVWNIMMQKKSIG